MLQVLVEKRESSALAKDSKGARKRKIHVAFFAARLESKASREKDPKLKLTRSEKKSKDE